jgi:hypothetical protein
MNVFTKFLITATNSRLDYLGNAGQKHRLHAHRFIFKTL